MPPASLTLCRRAAPWLLAILLTPAFAVSGQAPEDEVVTATVSKYDEALESFDLDALEKLLTPSFSESTTGCGPSKPRSTRKEYLQTLSKVAGMQPTHRRERGPLEITRLGDGSVYVVRSSVTDVVEWASGSVTARSTEALYLGRVGQGFRITSLNARLGCSDLVVEGTLPEPSSR